MALMLGQLLGANDAAILAVFQLLRQSRTQREAISEAARMTCTAADIDLINAILNVHKSTEAERNALTHGHLGVYSLLEDGILWLSAADYIAFKAELVLAGDRAYDDAKRDKLNSALFYYKKVDLDRIVTAVDDLGWVWSDAISYLQEKNPPTRAAKYRQLCDRPRIAQELETLRRQKTPPTPRE
jgi:hypothetical protein